MMAKHTAGGRGRGKTAVAKKPGRPELPPAERRERTIRIRATESEEAKFARLGGAEWFRAVLKSARIATNG